MRTIQNQMIVIILKRWVKAFLKIIESLSFFIQHDKRKLILGCDF